MKNNKIAYAIWLVSNLIAYAVLSITLDSIRATGYKTAIVGLTGNLYLYFFSLAIYIYCFAFLWHSLQEHLTLANELKEEKAKKNCLSLFFDAITNLILYQALVMCLVIPLWYWVARVCILLLVWLNTGEWIQYTSCDAIQVICDFDSRFVGVNIIARWVGDNDFGILLTLVCGGLGMLFRKYPNTQGE